MQYRVPGYMLQICLTVGLLWGSAAIAADTIRSEAIALSQQAAEVATLLEGVMDTVLQAKTNPKVANVQMTTCRVQLADAERRDTILLYQEQAIMPKLDQPYRQRFLEISPRALSQSVRSRSYKPVNATMFTNFCNTTAAKRTVTVKTLGEAVCSVILKRSGNEYIGVTPPTGCPTTARGAVRITNRIVLWKGGMNTWDRGFDASGKQVWGAQGESYQFRRSL